MSENDWQALWWPGPLTGLVAGVLALVTARFLVTRLPEPDHDPDDPFPKPAYASLRGPTMVLPSLALALMAGMTAPLAGPMVWAMVALAGIGAALVVVDAHTTYLPSPLHWLTTVLSGVGAVIGAALLAEPGRWMHLAMGAGFGAVASYALFWLVWRLGEGFGYGDVRLAGLVGALAGSLGLQLWWTALLSAAVVGAGLALGVAWYRRSHPSPLGSAFAYGPALWAGPFIALLLV